MMKFDYIIMTVWGFVVILNLASHNWSAAFNAIVVIFYIFVVDNLKKEIGRNDEIHNGNR